MWPWNCFVLPGYWSDGCTPPTGCQELLLFMLSVVVKRCWWGKSLHGIRLDYKITYLKRKVRYQWDVFVWGISLDPLVKKSMVLMSTPLIIQLWSGRHIPRLQSPRTVRPVPTILMYSCCWGWLEKKGLAPPCRCGCTTWSDTALQNSTLDQGD